MTTCQSLSAHANCWRKFVSTSPSRSQLLHCICPLLAQSGHRAAEFQCPLLGVKRTLSGAVAAMRLAASVASASVTGATVCLLPFALLSRTFLTIRAGRCRANMSRRRCCSIRKTAPSLICWSPDTTLTSWTDSALKASSPLIDVGKPGLGAARPVVALRRRRIGNASASAGVGRRARPIPRPPPRDIRCHDWRLGMR